MDSYIDVQGWFYVFNFIDWRNFFFFLHHLRALSAKNANHLQTTDTLKRHQRYSIHYHCGLPALPEPFLRACGLHRVCTRHKKTKQQSRSIMFMVIPCVQFYRLMQLLLSTLLKGIIRKHANHLQTTDTLKRHRRYSIHYHCGLPALPEPFLRACGLYRVCTGYQKIKTAEQFTLLLDSFATPICIWRSGD